jgi:acetolactate synthase-1/2/3 large subunit
MKISGAEAIVRTLIRNGADIMFGYPGGAIMPTYDELYHVRDMLHHVLVRHEQGAVHAAVGYARATGKVGVAMATSGPGATNLITGMADALLDSVPLVCITGQVAEHLLGTDAFQESDITGMAVPATKWSYQVVDAEEIPSAIDKAFEVAQRGRPGPVLIDITKNAQIAFFDYIEKKSDKQLPEIGTLMSKKDLAQAADLINSAKRPFMLIGNGVQISGAQKEVIELAEKADLAVASTLHGLSSMPTDHPNLVGYLGMHGNYGPNVLSNEADVVIAVGMRFDDRVTGNLANYLKDSKVIHIEIDDAEINKNVVTEVALMADAKAALKALMPLVNENKHPKWHQRFKECTQKEYDVVVKDQIHPKGPEIRMAQAINRLCEKTKGEAVIVTDVGQNQMMAARYYKFTKSCSHITSGGLGTMGYSLPAAIGAKIGQPDRVVVSISGDGGFQMNIQELALLNQENIDLKVIVLNNSWLGMVRQWQELFFDKRYSATDISSPNLQHIAQAYGIAGSKVEKSEELDEHLDKMLNHKGSYLLEIMVEKEGNVFPMVPTGASVSEVLLEPEAK